MSIRNSEPLQLNNDEDLATKDEDPCRRFTLPSYRRLPNTVNMATSKLQKKHAICKNPLITSAGTTEFTASLSEKCLYVSPRLGGCDLTIKLAQDKLSGLRKKKNFRVRSESACQRSALI